MKFSAILALCAATLTVGAAPTANFVYTSGQKFYLNGLKYTFAGTNAYWLAQMSNSDIDKAFSDIAASGVTTVRTWGFNDVTSIPSTGTYYQLWTNGTATINYGSNGLAKFDYVVQSAAAHGLHLIVTLTNNWVDYGGMDVYVSQLDPSGGGYHDLFYTDPTIQAAYKTYVSAWISRYSSNPTIMSWELANEPRCAGSTTVASSACDTTTITTWVSTMSAYIKSLDKNHLVAIGDEGWFQRPGAQPYPYDPSVGISFDDNILVPTLDWATLHLYPEYWGEADNVTEFGIAWIRDHAAVQKTANKPVVIEEFGVSIANQSEVYPYWWNEVLSSGMTGDAIWQSGSYLSTGPSPNDGFTYYPNGTVYQLVKGYAALLKLRG
ncbi:glycoside hydrolase family 5 protein [Calocera viscosa TUFC12733]|uniref:mannan endo-1,4-beta-mannosidase n=1 Tax=Calocera viscosa (strain TUFC12733) TaxID=1330018 RepID=A0A167G1U1_CALVF|nr:glycoside hydrolase family 5 protein [Calocera viscosa TUFC12733]